MNEDATGSKEQEAAEIIMKTGACQKSEYMWAGALSIKIYPRLWRFWKAETSGKQHVWGVGREPRPPLGVAPRTVITVSKAGGTEGRSGVHAQHRTQKHGIMNYDGPRNGI